ncbi:MAG: SEC-C metal-binding domain-containing protein [Desulfobulbaceae bacterium]|jgi:SWIM/SEC-C metal-binding protein|nr:SEC-C metal-binding domain-containing protein [Desulfobulbaceae bacterium]
MVQKIFTNQQTGKTFDRDKGVKNINKNRYPKLGTKRNPATVYVQTEAREKEVNAVFQENNWVSTIIIAPDRPEDISALEILLNPVQTKTNKHDIGRNDPCYCGSGKKFKKCCANKPV